jgi:hypothetical protein
VKKNRPYWATNFAGLTKKLAHFGEPLDDFPLVVEQCCERKKEITEIKERG